jgi:predicted nucleotidyltransferase
MKIKDKQKIFSEIVERYRVIFGEKLLSIHIYGSAVTEDFNPKYSDINVAIILENLSPHTLIAAKEVIKKFKRKRVSAPLFLTKAYIESSLDTFPIEFLNIKSAHKTIYGDDFFEKLKINSEYLRLQAERELKGKLLTLRLAFLENIGNLRVIKNLVCSSFSSFIPVMKAIIIFKNQEIPVRTIDIIRKTAGLLNIDFTVFLQASDIRGRNIKMKGEQLVEFFERYVQTVDQLSEIVDKL